MLHSKEMSKKTLKKTKLGKKSIKISPFFNKHQTLKITAFRKKNSPNAINNELIKKTNKKHLKGQTDINSSNWVQKCNTLSDHQKDLETH